MNYKHCQSGA